MFFKPELDISGVAQFRHLYIQREGEQDPKEIRLKFSFLEGDRLLFVLNASQDSVSEIHFKLRDFVHTEKLELNRLGHGSTWSEAGGAGVP